MNKLCTAAVTFRAGSCSIMMTILLGWHDDGFVPLYPAHNRNYRRVYSLYKRTFTLMEHSNVSDGKWYNRRSER
jgi:hypothetical protein